MRLKHILKIRFALFVILLMACFLWPTSIVFSDGADDPTIILLGGERTQRASPAVADLNGDGDLEIVVGTYDGMLHVIAYDGTTWNTVWSRQTALDINAAGPPTAQSTGRIESSPAIGDLDGDGNLEIVVTVGGLPNQRKNGGVLVYTFQGEWNFAIQGDWPQPKLDIVGSGAGASNPDGYWDGILTSPAIGDLDGDGDLEIVVEGEDRAIHAWEHTGAYVPNWPLSNRNGDNVSRGGLSSPALADIDGDGLPEIIVGGNNPRWPEGGNPDFGYATLWAINGDKTMVPGWPNYIREWIDSSPAVGDIDGDGELEIVVGTGRNGISGNGGEYIYAWNADGSTLNGWPRPIGSNAIASPALADLDKDGVLDVIIGCGMEAPGTCYNLYAWRGDGSNLPGFPTQPLLPNINFHNPERQPYSPMVADIDTDGQLEILVIPLGSVGITVVEHDGSINPDFSRVQTDFVEARATPVVADVDNDGLLEIVYAGQSQSQAAVYIWQEDGAADNELPWPMFHQNVARTGLSPQVANISGTVYEPDGLPRADVMLTLDTGITTTTAADGSYTFVEAPAGERTITPVLPGNVFSPTERTITIPPDAIGQDFELVYFSLSGQVTDDGNPLAGVTVNLSTGDSDVTEADGLYNFADLLPGEYTLTPQLDGYTFDPPTRTVTLPPDGLNLDFAVAYYEVGGLIRGSNGLALNGVQVNNGQGDSVTTNSQGVFNFPKLLAGSYTLTPSLSDFVFTPPLRDVTLPPSTLNQHFIALPQPVSDTVMPNFETTLSFNDTQGLSTEVFVPTTAVMTAATLVLSPTLPSGKAYFATNGTGSLIAGSQVFLPAGHAFDLTAYMNDVPVTDYHFQNPIEISIAYSEADIRLVSNEEDLYLLMWHNGVWTDATDSCSPRGTYTRDLAGNSLSVEICHLTQMGLFGPSQQVYLPLILR